MKPRTTDGLADAADGHGAAAKPARLASIDAYRGFVMFLMMAEVLRLHAIAAARPGSGFWRLLAHHQEHVEWVGCTLHDLIQPSFSFLVGVSLPFSIAARLRRGESQARMTVHALWRSLVLVALGVFLRSVGREQTNFTFEDTLSQIGLGYTFLFLLGLRPTRDRLIALGLILVGYWAAFALYPLPGATFDPATVGVPADWPHQLKGFAAHWNKNTNPAWAFDTWFLNRFPRKEPFRFNGGGYATLSFIPTLATMILGLLAGGILAGEKRPSRRLLWLCGAGVLSLSCGLALGESGLCPIVKRIWTPSWVLFSGAFGFFFLAAFHAVLDVLGWRRLAFPLMVIGANSIAAYCMAHLVEGFLEQNFRTHLGGDVFRHFGPNFEPLVRGVAILASLWLILLWMYRRKIFLRI